MKKNSLGDSPSGENRNELWYHGNKEKEGKWNCVSEVMIYKGVWDAYLYMNVIIKKGKKKKKP